MHNSEESSIALNKKLLIYYHEISQKREHIIQGGW